MIKISGGWELLVLTCLNTLICGRFCVWLRTWIEYVRVRVDVVIQKLG